MFELRIYKVFSSIISNWLSVRVRFLVDVPSVIVQVVYCNSRILLRESLERRFIR